MSCCKLQIFKTHITTAHRCGTCGTFGHGQVECGKHDNIQALFRMIQSQDCMNTPCTISGCTWSWSHTTEAHHCTQCGRRGGCDCNVHVETKIKYPHCNLSCTFDDSLVFTGNQCTICFEDGPVVIFKPCKHANVCKSCAHIIAAS